MSENSHKNNDLNNQVTIAYNETLQYLYSRLAVFHHIGAAAYKPGLDNTIQLMSALNNPQNSYRTIHIAGTNGKGSVSHLLAAVLQKAGYKVGLYTSPHLVDFGERIRVNGEMIEQQFVVDFVSEHKDLFLQIEPSFFEATMALAFDYFAHCKVDIAIIEVGLGGRLDSTNIIQPELSVITNISYDHVEFLGNTLEKIAFEKAGIIKHQIPVVIGEVLPETRTAFELKAKEQEATIIYAEEQIKVKFIAYSDKKMIVETADNKTFKVGLNGIYQLKNIATTLTAIYELQKLNFIISNESILDGIENVVEITGLKGRWQELHQHPLVICDTGHNSAGIEIVANQLKTLNYNTLRIVIGMVSDKEISEVLALLPTNAIYYFTQANISRALPAQELEKKATNFGLLGKVFKTVNEAVTTAMKDADAEDMIFIGGSNFIVGEALPYFEKQKKA